MVQDIRINPIGGASSPPELGVGGLEVPLFLPQLKIHPLINILKGNLKLDRS